ncbi:MAG: energy-coupling factor ABC transporter permease [Austwickia sp.]|nr:energy-coupling factor ABC transporter permease [Austwickia sp.]
MHVPDGFLDVTTSVGTGAVAAAAVALAVRRASPEVRRSGPALAGLTSAFVFAVQMVNFPVGAGTSGHLMGGALAAALVGPWAAVLCLTCVLLVQGLLFADGGLTALGTNVLLIGVVTVLVGHLVTRALTAVLPRRPAAVVPAAALGGLVSVPAAAAVFVGLYAVGGAAPIPLGTLMTAMLGWHAVIGIGEAVITAAVLGAVAAARPDVVHACRKSPTARLMLDDDGVLRGVPLPGRPASARVLLAWLGGLSLLIAGGLSLLASSHPDGLESVAEQLGFAETAAESGASGSPLNGYEVAGLAHPWGAVLAGILGLLITVLVGLALAALVRGRRGDQPRVGASATEPTSPAAPGLR